VTRRSFRSLSSALIVIATLVVASPGAGARTSDILRLEDFPAGWEATPVLPSDDDAPTTPACEALAEQQRKSIETVGTPKFVDPRSPSEYNIVAASVTTMPSSRAAREQVAALLKRRLFQCLIDSTNAGFDSENGGAKASTVVHEIRIPHADAHVHALRAKTTVSGFEGFVYTQQVVFVQDGKRIVTLHVDTEDSADYTALRNRLVPLIQRRLRDGGALHV
jgi:hypothetical protein